MKKILFLFIYCFFNHIDIFAQKGTWLDKRAETTNGRNQVIDEAVKEMNLYFNNFISDFSLKLSNPRYPSNYCPSEPLPTVYFHNRRTGIKLEQTIKFREFDNCMYIVRTNEGVECDSKDFACSITISKPTMRFVFLSSEEKINIDQNGRTSRVVPRCDLTLDEKEFFRTNMPSTLLERYKYIVPLTNNDNIPACAPVGSLSALHCHVLFCSTPSSLGK
jgi:hypothetical protein